MKIYYITASCGDGSYRTDFYDSQECIDFVTDYDNGREEYWDGASGGSWGSFEAPGGIEFRSRYQKVMSMSDIRDEED